MAARITSAAFLFILLLANGYAYRILFMLPLCTKSHKVVLDPVAQELASRGHEVTMIASAVTIKNSTNLSNIYLENVASLWQQANFSFFNMSMRDLAQLRTFFAFTVDIVHATFKSEPIADYILHPRDSDGNPRFDVVVIDAVVNEASLAVAHHLGAPVVYIAPTVLFSPTAWNLNVPQPPYVQSLLPFAEEHMTFLDRAKSTAMSVALLLSRAFIILPMIDEAISQHLPNSPPVADLERGISFAISNSHFSIHPRMPTMPYFIEAGGLHCLPAKALPKDFEDFMQSADDHGVIFFSIGSVTKGELMPQDMLDKIIDVFEKLPYKILWKFEDANFNLSQDKYKFSNWMPQQDILAHPKTSLFLSHGGGMSTQEAAYHGCPMVIIPIGADQFANAQFAVRKGFAETVNWETFTVEELINKINLVITEKRYRESALTTSRLLQDRPIPPVKEAAYWVEYVVRHKGAPHLKSGADKLNFFQYFLLDVIAVIVSIFLIALFVVCLLLLKCYQLVRRVFGAGKKLKKK